MQRWESGNIKNVRFEKFALLCEISHATPAEIMGWDELDVITSNIYKNCLITENCAINIKKVLKKSIGYSKIVVAQTTKEE